VLCACTPVEGGERDDGPVALRLGYFPNVTHAAALVGIEEGLIADALGEGAELETQAFNAGPDVIEAIFNGALDASFIGPNPAINGFTRSNGEAIRIVSGATSGGAALVVREGITSVEQLAGTTLATPQLGNTQDVALRAWLAEQGYETDLEGGGDVSVVPQSNGDALTAFAAGDIDGAWVPEPWATRMVEEGGGTVLVDERDLWPNGRFVTTHLIVATEFLEEHPDVVRGLLAGHVAATDMLLEDPERAQDIVSGAIAKLTDTELPAGTLAAAWENLEFTVDPIATSLAASASDAVALGLLDNGDIDGIYDLALLNDVLTELGRNGIRQP
ncbi:MAG: ABC transporter substrate-binding protein, partial [Chloroflexota bacterium]|nr:ABC transporter substrate-binding protein [Chloroflexota bacterium]